MSPKDDQSSSQFDTGFGSGGTFGGTSGGGSSKSQSQMGGEFGSGFGGGTNAVSQIFRDNGSGGDDQRRKIMLLLGAIVGSAALYAGYVFFIEDAQSTEEPIIATTPAPKAESDVGAKPADAASLESDAAADEEEGTEEDDGELAEAPAAAPSSAGSYTYSEIGGGPIVQAPAGTPIEASRKQDFSEIYMTGVTDAAGQLRIPNPPPGKVYWRVAGKSEVTEISILPAAPLNLSMSLGSSMSANDTVQWSSNGDAAHFRLEFSSDGSFSNVVYSFSTGKTQLALSGVSPGNYFVRVGGLNVASGRWEFTRGASVEVK